MASSVAATATSVNGSRGLDAEQLRLDRRRGEERADGAEGDAREAEAE